MKSNYNTAGKCPNCNNTLSVYTMNLNERCPFCSNIYSTKQAIQLFKENNNKKASVPIPQNFTNTTRFTGLCPNCKKMITTNPCNHFEKCPFCLALYEPRYAINLFSNYNNKNNNKKKNKYSPAYSAASAQAICPACGKEIPVNPYLMGSNCQYCNAYFIVLDAMAAYNAKKQQPQPRNEAPVINIIQPDTKIIPSTCPKCGANITINSQSKQATCNYCGFSFIIDKPDIPSFTVKTISSNSSQNTTTYEFTSSTSVEQKRMLNGLPHIQEKKSIDPALFTPFLNIGLPIIMIIIIFFMIIICL